MTLTRRVTTGLIEVYAPDFMRFVHERRDPCPMFPWDGVERLELHHLGQPGERGWSMRRRNDGIGVLIPASVHARHTEWEADAGLLAACVAYALADFLQWLADPEDTEPRHGDPLTRIVQAALVLAQRSQDPHDWQIGFGSRANALRLLNESRVRAQNLARLDNASPELLAALEQIAQAEKTLMEGS
ncbi:hypothetical protein DM785_02465 [Deinococcus actinosclerus]|nr:hypothetical protein DM785_02465 [Deinococcus actinosclerus]